jgi:cytochrome c551
MKLNFSLGLLLISFFMISCDAGPASKSEAYQKLDNNSKIRFNQYMLEGQNLYTIHCSNCHQKDGSGLGKLIPPLAGADYLRNNLASSVCGIKNGLKGEIVVNGIPYNQPMPANPTLKNLDIAQVITYIGNTWGNEIGLIETEQIVEMLENCEDQN